MTRLTRFFLALSLTAFAAGLVVCFTNINAHPSWSGALPAGAISFGLFLISFMLEKEMAGFDTEETRRMQLARRYVTAAEPAPEASPERVTEVACAATR